MLKLRLLSAVTAITVVSAAFVATAEPAAAHVDHFCGFVLQPTQVCGNGVRDDWDRVRTRYPGLQAHNVTGCVYMYNVRTNQFRGGYVACGRTWSSPTSNPFGWNYGDTFENDYLSFNQLPGNQAPHTLVGWTSTNQTDG